MKYRKKIKVHKNAQSSLEFLMTYGWAFSIIIISFGVISYAGLFDLDQLVEEKCEFLSGLICIDMLVNNTGGILAIQNGLPVDITGVSLYVESCGATTGPAALASGAVANYTVSCTLPVGTLRARIFANYTNPDSNFNHTKTGDLVYKVR